MRDWRSTSSSRQNMISNRQGRDAGRKDTSKQGNKYYIKYQPLRVEKA
jgi:hypothetical protein